MSVVPFRAEHLLRFDFQPAQRWLADYKFVNSIVTLEGAHAWTVLDDNGPLCCGGAYELWSGRAHVWAYLSSRVSARNMVRIQRVAFNAIEALPFRRCEAAVEVGFKPGHRLVKSLGFQCETPEPAKAYFPNGAHALLYARVKG